MKPFEIFCTCPPGLEQLLQAEALEKGFTGAQAIPGGVRFAGLWPNVMRANLHLRGATRVLARIARAEIHNLSQLERYARDIPWAQTFRADVPIRIDASCKRSKINHAGAAKTRLERALAATLGAQVSADAPVTLMLRMDNNKATFSVDTSGAPLHMRGTKQAVGKAPLRETLAALCLRACGYDGSEPVLDPMCGSGTFPLEAADIAAGLAPGRMRSFAFEQLATFLPRHHTIHTCAYQCPRTPGRTARPCHLQPALRDTDRRQTPTGGALSNPWQTAQIRFLGLARGACDNRRVPRLCDWPAL